MIIFIVHDLDFLAFKTKGNPPISTDINSPRSGSISFQLVKPKTWKIHVFRLPGSMKAAEYQAEPFRVRGLDSRSIAGFEKALQALVLETPDHGPSVTWSVTGINHIADVPFASSWIPAFAGMTVGLRRMIGSAGFLRSRE